MEWGAFRTDRLNRSDHQQFHKRVRFFGFIGAGWAAPDSGLYLDPFQFHETTRANVFIELIGPTHGWICRAFTDLRESLRWFPAANRRRDADMAESTVSANAAPWPKALAAFGHPAQSRAMQHSSGITLQIDVSLETSNCNLTMRDDLTQFTKAASLAMSNA
jgi:hypothetical protein